MVPVLSWGLEFNIWISPRGKLKMVMRVCGLPGLRAKLSMRLFQAMKAIFLMVGDELRKPSSSRCRRELMKGPPLCSNCRTNIHIRLKKMSFANTDCWELSGKIMVRWCKKVCIYSTSNQVFTSLIDFPCNHFYELNHGQHTYTQTFAVYLVMWMN